MSSQINKKLEKLMSDYDLMQSSNSSTNSYLQLLNTFLQDISDLNCSDIKDLVSKYADDSIKPLKTHINGFSNEFNSNKSIIENMTKSAATITKKLYCLFDEINKQILTDSSDTKFDLPEFNKLNDIIITSLGGYTSKSHNWYLVTILILVIVIFILLFMRLV